MRIISFDVGIKNLAYCYFESDSKTIIDWDVVDLCDDKRVCSTQGCGKNATYVKHDTYYCNKHTKDFLKVHTEFRIPEEKVCKDAMTELSSTKLKKVMTSLGLPHNSIVKESTDDIREKLFSYVDENLMESVMTRNAKNVDLIEIGRNIDTYFARVFSADFGMLTPELVLIENQISPIANRMKTIQGMIAQFFITFFPGCDIDIKFVSSSNKLKGFVDSSETTTYDERKKKGIIVARELINSHDVNRERWLDKYEKHSKKDDLADSFLQGIWYSRTILKEAE